MKKLSVLLMGIALVGFVAVTSCGTKEAKSDTNSECCEKNDTSACCDKKDSTACVEQTDSCSTPCDSTKKTEGEHKDCDHKH